MCWLTADWVQHSVRATALRFPVSYTVMNTRRSSRVTTPKLSLGLLTGNPGIDLDYYRLPRWGQQLGTPRARRQPARGARTMSSGGPGRTALTPWVHRGRVPTIFQSQEASPWPPAVTSSLRSRP